jgi:hypothetical protein
MNRWIMRLLAGVAVTQAGAVGTAMATPDTVTTPDEQAWQQALSANTLEAYAKFSMEFPESRHARHARSRLTTISASFVYEEEVDAEPDADAKADAAADETGNTAAPDFVPGSIMVV